MRVCPPRPLSRVAGKDMPTTHKRNQNTKQKQTIVLAPWIWIPTEGSNIFDIKPKTSHFQYRLDALPNISTMKYRTHAITALLITLNVRTIRGNKSSNSLSSMTKHFHIEHDARPHGSKIMPDIGILDCRHIGMTGPSCNLLSCPATCKNEELCDCMQGYYSLEDGERCFSVMLSGCRNEEF